MMSVMVDLEETAYYQVDFPLKINSSSTYPLVKQTSVKKNQ